MHVWIYVEGESDKLALEALWAAWMKQLKQEGKGIRIVPLDDKKRLLSRMGARAAEKLFASSSDLVVGLPDLYPCLEFNNSRFAHGNLEELHDLQVREVAKALKDVYQVDASTYLSRFLPAALKHDLEVLLLAAESRMKEYLSHPRSLGSWQVPVENQNQSRPPKRVVEEIFRTRSSDRKCYRDTIHAPAILRRVRDQREVIFTDTNAVTCPEFKRVLDWLGTHLGVPAY
jgi:hypothetical protein